MIQLELNVKVTITSSVSASSLKKWTYLHRELAGLNRRYSTFWGCRSTV